MKKEKLPKNSSKGSRENKDYTPEDEKELDSMAQEFVKGVNKAAKEGK